MELRMSYICQLLDVYLSLNRSGSSSPNHLQTHWVTISRSQIIERPEPHGEKVGPKHRFMDSLQVAGNMARAAAITLGIGQAEIGQLILTEDVKNHQLDGSHLMSLKDYCMG